MEVLLIVASFLCLLAGIAGCVLPMLPGPPIAYVGMLLLHFTSGVEFSLWTLGFSLVVVVAITVLDYVIPMLGSKYIGGTSWGNRGCVAGTIVGMFFMPLGIIAGPFLGAYFGELLGGQNSSQALRSGFGSLLGFLTGTVLKLVVCLWFTFMCIKALF